MKTLLIDLFGDYQPYERQITEVLYDSNGESVGTSVQTVYEPDFVWLSGVFGFFLVLFCVMRFIYNVIGGRK